MGSRYRGCNGAVEKVPVSLHCWQLDDVMGFDNDGALTGGIQTTGNYPGRAKTPEQLMADMEEAMKLMPGTAKLNIHASYAIFEDGEYADRNALEPKHFANGWHLQRNIIWELILTRLSFLMRK